MKSLIIILICCLIATPVIAIESAENRNLQAAFMNKDLFDARIDGTVEALGKNKTVLKITTANMDRMQVRVLINNDKNIKDWTAAGFTKVIFTNYRGETWEYKLKK